MMTDGEDAVGSKAAADTQSVAQAVGHGHRPAARGAGIVWVGSHAVATRDVRAGAQAAGAEVILQPTATRTVDREQEIVLARANAITNQVFIVNPNNGALFGAGRSVIVDPEGRVLALGGSGEEFLTQMIDLDAGTATREHGTAGLNPLWKQLRDAPPPLIGPYRDGFAAGDVMKGLGPLGAARGPSRTR